MEAIYVRVCVRVCVYLLPVLEETEAIDFVSGVKYTVLLSHLTVSAQNSGSFVERGE